MSEHLRGLSFLQNVAPALLIQFLREHRSEWAELDVCTDIAAALGHGPSLVSRHGNSYCGSAPLLLAHSFEKQEVKNIGIPTMYMISSPCILFSRRASHLGCHA